MYEQIAANRRKTVVLLLAAAAFAGLIGYAIGCTGTPDPSGS